MMIVPKLDAGDILLQEKTPISAEDTTETVHDRLSVIGANLIVPTLKGLYDGTMKRIPQDESKVTYAHKLTKEMENLDWSESARTIDLKVRALNPWPGTRIETIDGLRFKIKKGRPMVGAPFRVGAGELQASGGELILGTADGSYQVLELQEDGKKPMLGSDFINGVKNRGLNLPLKLKPFVKAGEVNPV